MAREDSPIHNLRAAFLTGAGSEWILGQLESRTRFARSPDTSTPPADDPLLNGLKIRLTEKTMMGCGERIRQWWKWFLDLFRARETGTSEQSSPVTEYYSAIEGADSVSEWTEETPSSKASWDSVFDRSSFTASSSTPWSSSSSAATTSSSVKSAHSYSLSSAATTHSDSTIMDVRALPELAWFAQPHEEERRRRLGVLHRARLAEMVRFGRRPRLNVRGRPFTPARARHARAWPALAQLSLA